MLVFSDPTWWEASKPYSARQPGEWYILTLYSGIIFSFHTWPIFFKHRFCIECYKSYIGVCLLCLEAVFHVKDRSLSVNICLLHETSNISSCIWLYLSVAAELDYSAGLVWRDEQIVSSSEEFWNCLQQLYCKQGYYAGNNSRLNLLIGIRALQY